MGTGNSQTELSQPNVDAAKKEFRTKDELCLIFHSRQNTVKYLNIRKTKRFFHGIMPPKDRIASSEDPDQTALLGAV